MDQSDYSGYESARNRDRIKELEDRVAKLESIIYATETKNPPKQSLELRKMGFIRSVLQHSNKYSGGMLKDFSDYWTECGENDRKMRFEKEKVFEISKRLSRWHANRRTNNNGRGQITKGTTGLTTDLEQYAREAAGRLTGTECNNLHGRDKEHGLFEDVGYVEV